jgi:hypothetical protein
MPATTLLDHVDEAQWQGYQATLLALAEAGSAAGASRRRELAADVLQHVDDLFCAQQSDAERRVWRQVGRALRALGHGALWPALYALSDDGRHGCLETGDADALLDDPQGPVPVPDPPAGWPGALAPVVEPGATREEALRAGVDLAALVALCVRGVGDIYCPTGVEDREWYAVHEDGTVDEAERVFGAAHEAWNRALDEAAARPVSEALLEDLARFVALRGPGRGSG